MPKRNPVIGKRQGRFFIVAAAFALLSGDLYLIACIALSEVALFYGDRRVLPSQQDSVPENSQVSQQPNLPKELGINQTALLRGLYVIAVAGIYLLFYNNNLTVLLWDYTGEPKGSVMMFCLGGYANGIVYVASVLDRLKRIYLRRSLWHSVGQVAAFTMLGITIGGLVSLYLPK